MTEMTREKPQMLSTEDPILEKIDRLDGELAHHFRDKFMIQSSLTRTMVSFQANKNRPIYRWYKYKEAFSASLVEYFINAYGIARSRLLDPFAGSGTALFASSAAGLDADGIELLPIAQEIMSTRICLEREFTVDDRATLQQWSTTYPWEHSNVRENLTKVRITDGAYPIQTLDAIECYLGTCKQENERVRAVLRFVLLCVLESISYTRKDGQYLRWDYRSGHRQGVKPFHKGTIQVFKQAVCAKINEILLDLNNINNRWELFPVEHSPGAIQIYNGSCLNLMPALPDATYDVIFTSPPYCNRYDYTRTYALELALLGMNEQAIAQLRQQMLSATVENRAKDLLQINLQWTTALETADNQQLLQAILEHLENQRITGRLNNNGLPRMVRGYFYEMACVIAECSRVMKPNALLFMVNDNVRYAGACISVDMILSHMAENLGFRVENILILPNGKGNSSQQMGRHGREELRKCVYVWRKE